MKKGATIFTKKIFFFKTPLFSFTKKDFLFVFVAAEMHYKLTKKRYEGCSRFVGGGGEVGRNQQQAHTQKEASWVDTRERGEEGRGGGGKGREQRCQMT